MQTPTDSSCTSSNANGASGSLPAITVIQVEIIEIRSLQSLQIPSWPGSIWTDQYHLNARVERRANSWFLFYCQRLQATAITDLTAVKECMTDPTASACTDTYGSRFLAPPRINHLSECVSLDSFSISAPTYQLSWRQNVTAPHVPRLPQTLMLSKNVSRVR